MNYIERRFFIVFLLIFSCFSYLFATNYYVRKSGNNSNNGLTPETAWKTVSKAASSSLTPGDTVFIGKGNYNERITISHSGALNNPVVYYGDYIGIRTGDGAGEIKLGRRGSGEDDDDEDDDDDTGNSDQACTVKNKSNIDFHRITFKDSKKRGIYLKNAENIRIKSCRFTDNNQYGIYCTGAKGFLEIVSDSLYYCNAAAICVISSNSNLRLLIKGNYLEDHKYGIYLRSTNVDSICYNTIHDIYYYGLLVQYSNECNTICNNTIYDVWKYYGIYISRTNCSNIVNNTIYNIQCRGIYAYSNSSSYSIGSIQNNLIHDIWCDNGIYINRMNCNKISNNTIYEIDDRGIYFYGNNAYTVNSVDSNYIHDCWKEGIHLNRAKNVNSISKNVVYKTTSGIYWNSSKYYTIASLSGNILFSNYYYGIYLNKNKNSTLSNNLIYANKYWDSQGIYIANNGNKTINLINNTIYQAGKGGIYGKNVSGTWKNNIVMGHNTWGIKGYGNFNVNTSYNCVYDNNTNWAKYASQGTGSFSENPLFVDPDGEDDEIGDSNWNDDDLNIKSTGGSWHFGQWYVDDEDSPCRDTGDPNDDYSFEPEDNGDRINIGCYGNTYQASKSAIGCPITAIYPAFPDSEWVMIGMPIEPWEGEPLGDPYAVFADDFGGEMPDGTNWYCIHWTTEDSVSEYYEYGDGTIYQPPDCYPGIGYFVWHGMSNPVDVDVVGCPINSCTLNVAQAPEVDWYPPAPGFNQFANPYYFTTDWSNTIVLNTPRQGEGGEPTEYTLPEAANLGWISQYAYIWNYEVDQYEIIVPDADSEGDSLSVWQGYYFVQIDSMTNIKLIIPYETVLSKPPMRSKTLSKLGEKYKYRTSSISSQWNWFLKLGVVSDDRRLQDVENGIGVSAQATDGFDGWDAFDFRGTDMWGNFIQLEFAHEDGRTFAYDIHTIFDESSQWKFRVNTNGENTDRDFSLVWPQIRLIPENIKFSLYDSENSAILIDDLRTENSYGFKLPDTSRVFWIHAAKVDDNTPPTFGFVISQNRFAPNDLTLYIIPSEPLQSIEASADGENIELAELTSPPDLYYGKKYLTGSGSVSFNVNGTDAEGNSGNSTVTVQYHLMKPTQNNRITVTESGIELNVPSGALLNNATIVLSRCNMDLTAPSDMQLAGEYIYIGPEDITFAKKSLLTISSATESHSLGLYRYSGGKWKYISKYQKNMHISETGIYGLFNKTTSSITEDALPTVFTLSDCYPNPFNSSTTILYDIYKEGDVLLTVYDLLGREVQNLVSLRQLPGSYKIYWRGLNKQGIPVSSGTYFINLKVKDGKKILYQNKKKITLIK